MRILSLGAGVQSSAVLLMSISGELPPFDAVIFADPGWESKEVYDYLEYLKTICPIMVVSAGNLRTDALKSTIRDSKQPPEIPLFTKSTTGSIGAIRRQCTNRYKITPVRQAIRRLLNKSNPQPGEIELNMGISFDERQRISFSNVKYIIHHYPLVDLEMSRTDCLTWISDQGFKLPSRSSCLGCPYHSNREWRDIQNDHVKWADVVDFDNRIRNRGGVRGKLYLHRSCKPLSEIDFSNSEDKGQMNWLTERH